MQYTRTTVRIQTPIKKAADLLAAQGNLTFQTIINQALSKYLNSAQQDIAKKITFKTVNLGKGFDNLTRDDYYDEPQN